MRKGILKKMLSVVTAVTMVSFLLVGCGSSSKEESTDNAKSINIMVWAGTYSEDAFKEFTKKTGIKVNVSYVDNTDTLLSKLIEGDVEYDVIDLESAYVKTFVDNDLLVKLNLDNIPNRKNIEEAYYKEGAIGDKKFEYTVPDIAPGYTTIIYNKKTCPIKITKFSDLANPKLKGQVAMVNSTISLYGAALEALGYSANSTSEKEIKEANALLKKIKTNVKAFVGESAVSQLETGECSVALCWDYSLLCADSKENWSKFANADIDSNYEYFDQYWCVTSASKKQKQAEQFINYMLTPEANAMNLKEFGAVPLIKRKLIEPLLPKGYYKNPAIKAYEKLYNKSWKISVNDDQINLMDTYYTELMGN